MSIADARPHVMAPSLTAQEKSLLDFAMALKGHLRGGMKAALPEIYQSSAAPRFAAENSRTPQSWQDVNAAMTPERGYQWWSALLRTQQEYYLDVTSTACDRQLPDLIERFRAISNGPVKGSLTLDPSTEIPDYQALVDIHCVPGSYFLERTADDVWAGARSDLGSFVFAMGQHGAMNEDKGVAGAAFLKARFPGLKVSRLLDLGCTVGLSAMPALWSCKGRKPGQGRAFPPGQCRIHAV
jgi:hypothetical protein